MSSIAFVVRPATHSLAKSLRTLRWGRVPTNTTMRPLLPPSRPFLFHFAHILPESKQINFPKTAKMSSVAQAALSPEIVRSFTLKISRKTKPCKRRQPIKLVYLREQNGNEFPIVLQKKKTTTTTTTTINCRWFIWFILHHTMNGTLYSTPSSEPIENNKSCTYSCSWVVWCRRHSVQCVTVAILKSQIRLIYGRKS